MEKRVARHTVTSTLPTKEVAIRVLAVETYLGTQDNEQMVTGLLATPNLDLAVVETSDARPVHSIRVSLIFRTLSRTAGADVFR